MSLHRAGAGPGRGRGPGPGKGSQQQLQQQQAGLAIRRGIFLNGAASGPDPGSSANAGLLPQQQRHAGGTQNAETAAETDSPILMDDSVSEPGDHQLPPRLGRDTSMDRDSDAIMGDGESSSPAPRPASIITSSGAGAGAGAPGSGAGRERADLMTGSQNALYAARMQLQQRLQQRAPQHRLLQNRKPTRPSLSCMSSPYSSPLQSPMLSDSRDGDSESEPRRRGSSPNVYYSSLFPNVGGNGGGDASASASASVSLSVSVPAPQRAPDAAIAVPMDTTAADIAGRRKFTDVSGTSGAHSAVADVQPFSSSTSSPWSAHAAVPVSGMSRSPQSITARPEMGPSAIERELDARSRSEFFAASSTAAPGMVVDELAKKRRLAASSDDSASTSTHLGAQLQDQVQVHWQRQMQMPAPVPSHPVRRAGVVAGRGMYRSRRESAPIVGYSSSAPTSFSPLDSVVQGSGSAFNSRTGAIPPPSGMFESGGDNFVDTEMEHGDDRLSLDSLQFSPEGSSAMGVGMGEVGGGRLSFSTPVSPFELDPVRMASGFPPRPPLTMFAHGRNQYSASHARRSRRRHTYGGGIGSSPFTMEEFPQLPVLVQPSEQQQLLLEQEQQEQQQPHQQRQEEDEQDPPHELPVLDVELPQGYRFRHRQRRSSVSAESAVHDEAQDDNCGSSSSSSSSAAAAAAAAVAGGGATAAVPALPTRSSSSTTSMRMTGVTMSRGTDPSATQGMVIQGSGRRRRSSTIGMGSMNSVPLSSSAPAHPSFLSSGWGGGGSGGDARFSSAAFPQPNLHGMPSASQAHNFASSSYFDQNDPRSGTASSFMLDEHDDVHMLQLLASRSRSGGRFKSPEVLARIRLSVEGTVAFSGLNDEQKSIVFDAMEEQEFEAGDVVFAQGDDGDCFYVVDSGVFEAFTEVAQRRSKSTEYVGCGCFGEMALLHSAPRSCTVLAQTDGVLWCLQGETFRRLVIDSGKRAFEESSAFLRSYPLLLHLTEEERAMVAEAVEIETFKDGELVFSHGSDGEHFYLVEKGAAAVVYGDRVLNYVGPKGYFGELALMTGNPRSATVRAAGSLSCLVMHKLLFESVFADCKGILERHASTYLHPE